MAVEKFEYEFWTVSQLQAVGLTPAFATSFNYFVRDVAKINSGSNDLEGRVEQNEINIGNNATNISTNAGNITTNATNISTNVTAISYNFTYLNGALKPDDYVPATNYLIGEYVTEADIQYACINDTTGAFVPGDWFALSVQDNYKYIVDTRQEAREDFVTAAYGAIGLSTPTSLSDLAVGVWQTLPMDTETITTPKGVTQNLTNDSLSFGFEGLWNFSPTIELEFDEVNSSRRLLMRTYNITTATAGAFVYVSGVGRNADVGGFSFTVPIEISDALVGDEFVIQISANAAFTTVESINSVFYLSHASEAKFL
jgi:hypothetical protein